MADRDTLRDLRGLVARGDHAELVAALDTGQWPEHVLQLVGDGLLSALRAGTTDAEGVATQCVAALRHREWRGDEELAASLEAALGHGASPPLRSLSVNLDELAEVVEGDPMNGGGRIDLTTGAVWPESIFEGGGLDDEDELDLDNEDRWLHVECEGSHDAYGDMEWFIDDLEEAGNTVLADRLRRAIEGRGAFRRFKDTLSAHPELMSAFHAFSDERHRGRARRWLADAGCTPS